MTRYTYQFTDKSRKTLKKLPNPVQIRIIKKIKAYINTGSPVQFAEKLHNYETGEYRFRIGNYRAIFDIDGYILIFHNVGHRKEIYK